MSGLKASNIINFLSACTLCEENVAVISQQFEFALSKECLYCCWPLGGLAN